MQLKTGEALENLIKNEIIEKQNDYSTGIQAYLKLLSINSENNMLNNITVSETTTLPEKFDFYKYYLSISPNKKLSLYNVISISLIDLRKIFFLQHYYSVNDQEQKLLYDYFFYNFLEVQEQIMKPVLKDIENTNINYLKNKISDMHFFSLIVFIVIIIVTVAYFAGVWLRFIFNIEELFNDYLRVLNVIPKSVRYYIIDKISEIIFEEK